MNDSQKLQKILELVTQLPNREEFDALSQRVDELPTKDEVSDMITQSTQKLEETITTKIIDAIQGLTTGIDAQLGELKTQLSTLKKRVDRYHPVN